MDYLTLHGATTTVVVAHGDGPPRMLYWGPRLDDDPAWLALASDRPIPHASIDVEAPVAIVPELGSGFLGSPGLEGFRADGNAFAPRFSASAAPELDREGATLFAHDPIAQLALRIDLRLNPDSDVMQVRATLTNEAEQDYHLVRLAVSVPLPEHAGEVLDFSGRWCDEFHPRRTPWTSGSLLSENRRGRTSHDHVPVLFAGSPGFGEEAGDVWGVHLGWSGNSRMLAERLSDGRRHIQVGELLLPGEIALGHGESFTTPWLHASYAANGLGPVSRSFHRFLRQRSNWPQPATPRKVLLNTWEAVYFDHDLPTLYRLADAAAEVGAERFVLDDGWFHRRNNDAAALGDWWVDSVKYPDGLAPLVHHVNGLGMEFGLWFEPEMVNPDSELFRAHPEWTLADAHYSPILGRNQLVLNLAHPEAYAYILELVDRLLTDLDIGYVKWDMNRDHVQPVHEGRAGTHAQTLALYRLLDELGGRHPEVEIESCSSGGGRADFEILRRTTRIWTSDCNDALERQRIQRGFSMLLPPEVMGAHIGPHVSHTTRRTHDLGFRAATAFMGHLGIEWNLLQATPAERAEIADLVALHKHHRPLLHGGDVVRVDGDDAVCSTQGVVAPDGSEAIFVHARLDTGRESLPTPIRFSGLVGERQYRVRLLPMPGRPPDVGRTRPAWMDASSLQLTGRALMSIGLQAPILDPETALVFHLETVDTE